MQGLDGITVEQQTWKVRKLYKTTHVYPYGTSDPMFGLRTDCMVMVYKSVVDAIYLDVYYVSVLKENGTTETLCCREEDWGKCFVKVRKPCR